MPQTRSERINEFPLVDLLIYWLYAGMTLTLSGCDCLYEQEIPVKENLSKFDGRGYYWIREQVVLQRPLRVYPVPESEATGKCVGFGLIERLDETRFRKFLDGRAFYDVPTGTEIFLGKVTIRESFGMSDIGIGYFLSLEIPALTRNGFSVVYFMGCRGRLAPFPWTCDAAPMELWDPDDIELLLPGGKWKK